MSAPKEILELIERFGQHSEAYKSGQYNETQVRREFIDPFFRALGWDIDNEKGYSEAYKEVIHEDAIKIGGLTKAPDYCFRLGGIRKFFVEAKKPSVDVKDDIHPAFQLRRYVWSAKLPLSILTDFEELAVYDGRVRPDPKDKSSVARTLYMTYRDYADRWEEIVSLFSPDAILKGSFDRYVESAKIKKGTTTVDEVFLKEIESWRNELAHNIALRNDSLTQRELNFAVQQTIDRIIFLRICEDRGIEPYGQLMALQNGANAYERLVEHFRRADDRYNSGLFHFKKERERDESPDTLTLSLTIDDKVLKDIFKNLYYPDSPYEFSVLSADILGQVYEQFLGKVIRLTDGHRAVVEEKPETKKAGGVYYTPSYIVDYIVKHTLGKMLESKRPKQIAGISVLDPACGSGSFLIVAYQCLLDWYRDRYIEDGPEKYTKKSKPLLFRGPGGDWRLTTAERKRILLEHIYGVDIDAQAVEVTKLSLLLKVLEGESGESLTNQLRLFQERALPDLGSNIKCGNSLIEPDFYDNQQVEILSTEDQYRVNVFNWGKEFPDIMKVGGFDAVIGNPPYIRIQRIAYNESDYLFKKYQSPTSKMDLSLVFLEKGLNLINKTGLIGFICTSQWLTTDYGKNLRRILSNGQLHQIVDFGTLPVFQGASTYPAIFILGSQKASSLVIKRITTSDNLNLRDIEAAVSNTVDLSSLTEGPWNLGRLDITKILNRHRGQWKPLREFGKAYIGCKTGMNEAFVVTRDAAKKLRLEMGVLFAYAYRGEEISRYDQVDPDALVIYPYRETEAGNQILIPEDELKKNFPHVHEHLLSFKGRLRQRQDSRRFYADGPEWYRHLRSGSFNYIRPSKLVFKAISRNSSGGLLGENSAFDGANCPAILAENLRGHDIKYLLGILNSKLASYHLRSICPPKLSGYLKFSATCLSDVPIPLINFSDDSKKSYHDKIAVLAERMLDLKRQTAIVKTPQEKTSLERQLVATDQQIDGLVYELYGLNDKEIKIVEGASSE